MIDSDIEKIKMAFQGLTYNSWACVVSIMKKNKEVADIIEAELLAVPEYESKVSVVVCAMNNLKLKICKTCGKILTYSQSIRNQQDYCSYKCSYNSDDVKKKRKETCINKYGVSHVALLDSVKEKKKETNMERYGTVCLLNTKEVKNKIKEKYGCDNVSQNKDIREKVKKTCLQKYGHENVFQSSEIKGKSKNSILEKYGCENVSQSEEIKQKKKDSFFKKYNAETYAQSYEFLSEVYDRIIERWKDYVVPLFSKDEYKGYSSKNVYKWKCIKCGNEFEQHIYRNIVDGNVTYAPRCLKCYPHNEGVGVSFLEEEFSGFIKSIYNGTIERGNTEIISPYELDIYLPEIKLAIEFDGLFWHSDKFSRKKDYHLMKTEWCKTKGVFLVHVFEDEWIEKKEIVKDRIRAILGKNENKIFARKCEIKEIDSSISNEFLNDNHLQGGDKSSIRLGLFYSDELVSVMTFGIPRFNDNYDFELIRFASKRGVTIIGGAGKLLKYFERKYSGKSIISYADRRYSNGKLYESLRFQKLGFSPPNYYWTKGQIKVSRYKCQKHKLKELLKDNFHPDKTEDENMHLNDWNKVYDCGNIIYKKIAGD